VPIPGPSRRLSRNFRNPRTMTTNKPPKPVALVLVEDAGTLLKQESPFSRPFSGLGLSRSEGFCRCLKRIVAARTHVEKQELRYRGDSSLISNYGGESLCLSALEFGVLFLGSRLHVLLGQISQLLLQHFNLCYCIPISRWPSPPIHRMDTTHHFYSS
jgi:hypothetical protein